MPCSTDRQTRLRIHRFQTHQTHQPLHQFAIDSILVRVARGASCPGTVGCCRGRSRGYAEPGVPWAESRMSQCFLPVLRLPPLEWERDASPIPVWSNPQSGWLPFPPPFPPFPFLSFLPQGCAMHCRFAPRIASSAQQPRTCGPVSRQCLRMT